MNIRIAATEDLPRVAELFDLYRQFYEQAPDLPLARRFLSERFEKRDACILVAESETGDFTGFCQLYPTFCSIKAAPIYILSDLFVLPAARQHGVGRMLLLAAEEQARKDGKIRMDLTTAKTNFTAQSLYESIGWVRDEIFYAYNKHVAS